MGNRIWLRQMSPDGCSLSCHRAGEKVYGFLERGAGPAGSRFSQFCLPVLEVCRHWPSQQRLLLVAFVIDLEGQRLLTAVAENG